MNKPVLLIILILEIPFWKISELTSG